MKLTLATVLLLAGGVGANLFRVANVIFAFWDFGVIMSVPAWLTRREWWHRRSRGVFTTTSLVLVSCCALIVAHRCHLDRAKIVFIALTSSFLTILWVWITVVDSCRLRRARRAPRLVGAPSVIRCDGAYLLATFALVTGLPYTLAGFLTMSAKATSPVSEVARTIAWRSRDGAAHQEWVARPLGTHSLVVRRGRRRGRDRPCVAARQRHALPDRRDRRAARALAAPLADRALRGTLMMTWHIRMPSLNHDEITAVMRSCSSR